MVRSNVRFASWNKFLQWEKSPTDLQSLEEFVALLDAAYIFFGVFDFSPRRWCCDTTRLCYIFRQIFPFHSELRKDKTASWLRPPPVVFCQLPLFGGHMTSLNQGLSFLAPLGVGRWKTLGTRLTSAWGINEIMYEIYYILNCGCEIKWAMILAVMSVTPVSPGHGFKPPWSPEFFRLPCTVAKIARVIAHTISHPQLNIWYISYITLSSENFLTLPPGPNITFLQWLL